jgi:PAS domain S-box-containing protein
VQAGAQDYLVKGQFTNWTLLRSLRYSIERKRAETQQARLAAIVKHSADAIIAIALDGTITAWNPAAESMYGYTEAEALGPSLALRLRSDHPETLSRFLAMLARGEALAATDTKQGHRDGRGLIASLSISPVRNAAGQVVCGAVIARDITASRHVEADLRRYRLLADQTQDIILFIHEDGRLLDVNRAAVAVYGHDRAALLAMTAYDLCATRTTPDIPRTSPPRCLRDLASPRCTGARTAPRSRSRSARSPPRWMVSTSS